jgi:hypothetical protein
MIAVVILNWNGVLLLEQFLPSVVKNSQMQLFMLRIMPQQILLLLMLSTFPSVRIVKTKAIWALQAVTTKH